MSNDLIEIQYLPLSSKLNLELYRVFEKLNAMQGKNIDDYESTNIAGKYEDIVFTIYKDKNDNGKMCIIFIKEGSQKIIHINSSDINKYMSECTYYSEYDTSIGLFIESTGLKYLTRKYCKFQGETGNKNYTIILSENKKDNSYKYEMSLEQEDKRVSVECVWSHYQKYIKGDRPFQIIIKNNKTNEFIKFTLNNDTYQSVSGEKTYEEICKIVRMQGLSINNASSKRYVSRGIYLDGLETEIINRYLQNEKHKQELILKQTEEQINERNIEQTRRKISINTNENPQQEENIFIELGNISRRHAIRKIDNRGKTISINQNRK